MRTLILFLLIFIYCPKLQGAGIVSHYNPAVEELKGTVETQTFPGPPNYESIENGDEIERCWFLRLDHPIDVVANQPTTDLGWKTEKKVEILHMAIINDGDWKKVKNGKRVKVAGKLFNRQNGHHHSRVLIEVDRIDEIKK